MTNTPETNEPRTQNYGARILLNLDTMDRLDRNTFIKYATMEVDRLKESMVELIVKEYDERMAEKEQTNGTD